MKADRDQVENASPDTAVYANVSELRKNALQSSPPAASSTSPVPGAAPSSSSCSSSVSSPGALSPATSLDLPDGWRAHTDKDSGKEFYHHRATGRTTWADPRSSASPLSSPSSSADMDPPPVLLSPAPAPAAAPPLLSPGWEQLLDEASGRHFYHNPASGATSWSAPLTGSAPFSPGGAEAPTEGRRAEGGGPPPLPQEDYPTEEEEPGEAATPATPSSGVLRDMPPLALTQPKRAVIPRASLDMSAPAGWACSLDPEGKTVFTSERTQEQWIRSEDERRKTYYYLKDRSRSQWNLPELPAATCQPPRVGNGVDQEGPPVLKNWRHTMGPAQFGPNHEDSRFFPTHRRNMSEQGDAPGASHSPETPHRADTVKLQRRLSNMSTESHQLHGHLLEKAGILNKTKVADHGKRLRKSWGQSWTVLHGGILTFHRDPKSAPTSNSNKTSQIVPEHTVELRGATLFWASRDKSSKKNVLELKTRHSCEYLVQYDTESIICDWFKVILDTIRQLDQDHLSEEEEEEPTEKSPLPPDKDDKDRKRSSTKSTSGSVVDSEQGRVRTKLRKFLQRRPTLQSVKEKGYIRDNVFGCHLDTLCHRESTTVPKFVEKCIRAVERRGLDVDGIYRVSGNLAVIQKLRHKADHEENLDLEDGQWEEIHVITGALKLFLRELPEPLFPYSFFDKFIAAIKIPDYNQKVSYMRDLVRSLPLPNHDTMEHLFKHLRKVIEYGEANRMSVQSVAIVFGPTLLGPQTESANITIYMVFQNQIVELILNEFEKVFAPS